MNDVALIGRQTIFNRDLSIFGYELLYRPSETTNSAGEDFDGCRATCEVMLNAFMELGVTRIVGDKFAFINLTQEYIEGSLPIAFSKESVVLEILEDIEATEAILDGVKDLKSRGYTLALDDFVFEKRLMPFVPLVDIIKVDIMALDSTLLAIGLESIADIFKGKLLAEKVETQEEFDACKSLGFNYFQGYFLEKPIIVKGQKLPANKTATLQLLGRLQDPKVEFEELEEIIKQDPSLSFKLFRYINSPAFNLGANISSIKQALVLLGIESLKHWMTLIVISSASDKSTDLIIKALCRARMCELLSKVLKFENQSQYFLVGLFSNIDSMLSIEKTELFKNIPLKDKMKKALLEGEGKMGKILKCAIDYEYGRWEDLKCGKIPMSTIQKIYLKSIEWSNAQLSELK